MHFRFAPRPFSLSMSALLLTATAYATTPVVTVASPANGTTTTSPINYIASASSPGCTNGISAVRIYSAPGVSAYTASGGKLNSYINLPTSAYHTQGQAWENCGGVSKANANITITGRSRPAGIASI